MRISLQNEVNSVQHMQGILKNEQYFWFLPEICKKNFSEFCQNSFQRTSFIQHFAKIFKFWNFKSCHVLTKLMMKINQNREFVRGSITVSLTFCMTGLDLTKQVNLFQIQHNQSSWIQTNKTGGQPCSDTAVWFWSK